MNFEEYVRHGRALYEDFANVVAQILEAAIEAEQIQPYRWQPIQRRAKGIESLQHKIPNRLKLDPECIEDDIKDLAGCRVIFYTNSEVNRFLQSGIIPENFEVDLERTKIHHPIPGQNDGQFRSQNYVVRLTSNRAALPEYSRFKGLRCEIQVQTILNHAWADTSHGITYKRPELKGIGQRQLQQIDARLDRIMQDYLLPAGNEFQKIWSDYSRILEGKELLDIEATAQLVRCDNNNDRRDFLQRIQSYLLPNLDDLETSYPPIHDAIMQSISSARNTPAKPIEVAGGSFDGVDLEEYIDLAVETFKEYRYVDIGRTFKSAATLYLSARNDAERKSAISLAQSLAQYDVDVWRVRRQHS